jgi:hydroxymethylglutaryl-CoA reductase
MANNRPTSRIRGFYEKSICERIERLHETGLLDSEARRFLEGGGGLDVETADRMSENVLGSYGLPFALGLNFRVNQRDVLVPMVVEEPSVVAAASNAARIVRTTGGFFGDASDSVMTTQVQLDDVPNADGAPAIIERERAAILLAANRAIPRMVARGGGARDLDCRVLDAEQGVIVVNLYVDVGDAMGANLVDTVAEAVAPVVHGLLGGTMGLRILSNLPLRRLVRVRCAVSEDALGGAPLADGIVRASRFASLDPMRAVTHNKGIMNGVDAVALATGQDFRSIEAGAHAYASLSGKYGPLAVWRRTDTGVEGELEMPLAVGTVGGSTRANKGVRAAFQLLAVDGARELAVVIASAGLASNLAALRALAGEGIQKGHMRLHSRKDAAERAAEEAAAERGRP